MIQDRIEKLEQLAGQACAKLKLLEEENASLRAQVKSYSDSLASFERAKMELKEQKVWRFKLRSRLSRIDGKVEQLLEAAEAHSAPVAPAGEDGDAQ